MADDENKHMDVAKPGASKPDTGSKPMVVGHKPLTSDPAIREVESEKTEEELPAKEEPVAPSKKKKTIVPVSDDVKPEDGEIKKEPEQKPDEPSKETETTAAEEDPSEKPDEDTTTKKDETDTDKEKSKQEKEKSDLQLQREEKLQELIKSKKYNVPIKEASGSAVQTFMITFVFVALLGVVALALLVDAGTIDLGIELPFDLL